MVQTILQFLKTHLVVLLCGVASLAFIGITAMGMMSSTVVDQMNARVSKAQRIEGMKRNAKNQDMIEAEKRRGEQFNREYDETVKEAYRINERKPLIDGVFPKPATQTIPFRFVEHYDAELRKLPTRLNAGSTPTAAEIEIARSELTEEQIARAAAENADEEIVLSTGRGGQSTPRPTGAGPAPSPAVTGGPAIFGPGGQPQGIGPGFGPRRRPPERPRPGGNPAAPKAAAELEKSPERQAALSKAREIRMYMDEGALHTTGVRGAEVAPAVDDLWFAQMSLWIQEDVVGALADLQARHAQQLPGGEANVISLPIKRLESIRVNEYRLEDASVPFPVGSSRGAAVSGPGGRIGKTPTNTESSFTKRVSDDEFDVITFTVVLWVDQRDMLKVVDAIMKRNFYECYDIDFDVIPPAEIDPLYVFGPAPVVRMKLEFEGSFARAIYKQWIPAGVAAQLGIKNDDEG